jgi:hypothetical protein
MARAGVSRAARKPLGLPFLCHAWFKQPLLTSIIIFFWRNKDGTLD